MIPVSKPSKPPAALAAGAALTQANCEAYDLESAAYRSGAKRFTFKKSVYGPESVKNALKRAQHHKCCFCEARFAANYAGDVEHYRPKGAVTSPGQKLWPGYYWLAYAWSNLFYACADCNQYRKRDQFPLADEGARARDHHADLAAETPLLLDPGGDRDPRQHIIFKADVPVGQTDAGRVTINLLKLDREELNLARRSHLATLDHLLTITKLLEDDPRPDAVAAVRDARDILDRAQQPEAVYSAAAQDYLAARLGATAT